MPPGHLEDSNPQSALPNFRSTLLVLVPTHCVTAKVKSFRRPAKVARPVTDLRRFPAVPLDDPLRRRWRIASQEHGGKLRRQRFSLPERSQRCDDARVRGIDQGVEVTGAALSSCVALVGREGRKDLPPDDDLLSAFQADGETAMAVPRQRQGKARLGPDLQVGIGGASEQCTSRPMPLCFCRPVPADRLLCGTSDSKRRRLHRHGRRLPTPACSVDRFG